MARPGLSKSIASVLGFLLVLTALTGLALAAPSAQARVHQSATDQLTVTVGTAYSFTVSPSQVTPGDTVQLTIVQTDDVQHTFTLLNTPAGEVIDPASASESQIMGYLHTHPPLVNLTIDTGAHESTATFLAPAFGEYEYLCLTSGHFQNGMWGLLGSGEAGSGGTPPDTGPGAPVFIIGGTIVSLVVLTLVLAFVVGVREGSKHEMPPERLGYPEVPMRPAEPRPKP